MPHLLPGDPAPLFQAPTATSARQDFAALAGRYVLLAFPGPGAEEAWQALRAAQAEGVFDGGKAVGVLCVDDASDAILGSQAEAAPALHVFQDRQAAVSRLYGAAAPREGGGTALTPLVFLLDPLLRVMASAPIAGVGDLIATLRGLPEPALHAGQETPAPVLVLPRVLEPELCHRLIAVYEAGGGQESGFMADRNGELVWVYDRAAKRRRDQEIEDEALRGALRERIGRRVAPEMRKVFQFAPTRIERYIVACYDAGEAGHFRAHRDNDTPGTAHRRFAVSINLNDGFEGGDVWFPEFGPRRYRAPPGGAVVFSCSLLHEVTPVTQGRRYATLPFVYDEAARHGLEEAIRQRSRRLAGQEA
jgi:predicted 2-oxoglutarate/Fe(II)-dependent dioxygenase YbiX/peroxiredoxin